MRMLRLSLEVVSSATSLTSWIQSLKSPLRITVSGFDRFNIFTISWMLVEVVVSLFSAWGPVIPSSH
jgi:hypothetical protein